LVVVVCEEVLDPFSHKNIAAFIVTFIVVLTIVASLC